MPNRRPYGPLLPGVDHIRSTHDPERTFCWGRPGFGAAAWAGGLAVGTLSPAPGA